MLTQYVIICAAISQTTASPDFISAHCVVQDGKKMVVIAEISNVVPSPHPSSVSPERRKMIIAAVAGDGVISNLQIRPTFDVRAIQALERLESDFFVRTNNARYRLDPLYGFIKTTDFHNGAQNLIILSRTTSSLPSAVKIQKGKVILNISSGKAPYDQLRQIEATIAGEKQTLLDLNK